MVLTQEFKNFYVWNFIMWVTKYFPQGVEHTVMFYMEKKSEREGKNKWISALLLGIFCECEANFHHSRIGFSHMESIRRKT